MSHPGAPESDPYFSHEGKDAKKGQPSKSRVLAELKLIGETFGPGFAYLFPSSATVCRAAWKLYVSGIQPQKETWPRALWRVGLGLGVMLELLAVVMTVWSLLIVFGLASNPAYRTIR